MNFVEFINNEIFQYLTMIIFEYIKIINLAIDLENFCIGHFMDT